MSVNAAYRVCARAQPSGRRARTTRPWLLALVVAAAFGFQAADASAVVVHLAGGKALSYQPLRGAAAARASLTPFDALFKNLDYNGGPVMPSNTNYTIYWAPTGSPAYPSEYQTGVNRYLKDLAHDSGGHQNVDSVATQYNDAAGEFSNYDSHFGGELVDKDPYPVNGCAAATKCLTDEQIRKEIKAFVIKEKLPQGLTTEYFLLTPPKVESCFEPGACSAGSTQPFYCAYHGNIPSGETPIIYSNDPFVSAPAVEGCDDGNHPNGNQSDGVLEGGLSHEHNESITDPEPNNAWTDFGAETGEIGDKCGGELGAPLGETPSGAFYNQVVNGHFYWYQEEWSNQGHSCVQRFTFAGEAPKAKFIVSPGAGNEVHVDASGSSAPSGVFRYNWQFNDFGGEPSPPVEKTTPTLTHVFSVAGPHTVALTVLAANGTSMGAARTFVLGDTPPSSAFSVTTASPTAGQPVSFDASASAAGTGAISSYEWNFGDGSTGTGITPTHIYGAAGSYEAVLMVTDGSGFTTSAAHSLVVGATSPPGSPTVVTQGSSALGQSTVTLDGSVNPNGTNVTDCRFLYGATATYGSSAQCTLLPGAGSSPVAVSTSVAGLIPSTTYHFRLVATNTSGSASGTDLTFKTADLPPGVVTEPASVVGQTTATLNGGVNPHGTSVSDCRFEYGPTTTYGSSTSCAAMPGAGTGVVAVSATVGSLSPGTTYHFRLVATNASGTTQGLDETFSTASITSVVAAAETSFVASVPTLPSLVVCCAVASSPPSATQIAADLLAQLAHLGKSTTITALMRPAGLALAFHGPVAGTVVLSWYYLPRGARLGSRSRVKAVLVARGTLRGAGKAADSPWSGIVKMRLTRAGRRLLRHVRHLRITAQYIFTRVGAAPIAVSTAFTLRR